MSRHGLNIQGKCQSETGCACLSRRKSLGAPDREISAPVVGKAITADKAGKRIVTLMFDPRLRRVFAHKFVKMAVIGLRLV